MLEEVAGALGRFRRARERGWRKALLSLLAQEERKVLAQGVRELRATAASQGFTEEEALCRLAFPRTPMTTSSWASLWRGEGTAW
ncbi:hypothetical protein TJA_17610 [Thermus sp. LT1-2-5]|uniref:hypothetical protein n=1 Tax=Thermus sp. LT1-2-5 TaxID=3026935 RepID=UPI0030E79EF9